MKKAITEYYSENPKESEFYGKIVNKRNILIFYLKLFCFSYHR